MYSIIGILRKKLRRPILFKFYPKFHHSGPETKKGLVYFRAADPKSKMPSCMNRLIDTVFDEYDAWEYL